MLYVQSSRGQQSYMISTEAPGPLTVNSLGGVGSNLTAGWVDDADGYVVELNLAGDVERISIGAVAPAFGMPGISSGRYAGTLNGRQQGEWLELVSRDDGVARWLSKTVPEKSRAWLVQSDGWVVADSGPVRSRPQAVASSATSTSSRTPPLRRSCASATTADRRLERCGPRIEGMAQKLHVWSQPWLMRR